MVIFAHPLTRKQLHALSQGRPARVVTAMTMLKQYLYR